MMEEWIQLVSNVGFPIAVTLFILFRLEKTVKDNTKVINELILKIREWKK